MPSLDNALPTPSLWIPLHSIIGAGTTSETQHYSWTTSDLEPGRHRFRLRQRDLDGSERVLSVVEVTISLEGLGFSLTPPSPNPARGASQAMLHVSNAQYVRADLIDLLGRVVATVWEGELGPGSAQPLPIEAGELGVGLYLLHVRGERFTTTAPLRIVR